MCIGTVRRLAAMRLRFGDWYRFRRVRGLLCRRVGLWLFGLILVVRLLMDRLFRLWRRRRDRWMI